MANPLSTTNVVQMPAAALAETLIKFDRSTLASFVEVAIDILDCVDGDPDLENYDVDEEESDPDICSAYDDGMYAVHVNGRLRWGSDEDGDNGRIPNYGIDQTAPMQTSEWLGGVR